LPEGAQCLPRGYKPKASGSNVGKRQKQAHPQEKENDQHLKRGGAALIRDEKNSMAHEPTSTGQ